MRLGTYSERLKLADKLETAAYVARMGLGVMTVVKVKRRDKWTAYWAIFMLVGFAIPTPPAGHSAWYIAVCWFSNLVAAAVISRFIWRDLVSSRPR